MLGAAAALFGLVGCTARGDDAATATGTAVTVQNLAIIAPEKESDHGWNQQGLRAAREVAEDRGITLAEHPGVGYDNTESVLRQVSADGADLIIAHAGGFTTAAARTAESTRTPTLVVDEVKNAPGLVGTVLVAGEQGGYLAGVAAATATTTGAVGIVASADDLNWFSMAGGFAQGVHSVDPNINIRIAYIGPAEYGDSAGGRRIMNQVIAAGADVVIGMGDGATVGYLQAVESAATPVRYISTIGDVSETVQKPDTVIASVLWNFAGTYADAIDDLAAGTFGTHSYTLDVANGGITLDPGTGTTPDAVEAATAALSDGSISVTRATSRAEVQAIIDDRG